MTRKIFIGNLTFQTDTDKLRDAFETAYPGTIARVNVVCDRSGVSKGYGFVEFKNDAAANSALGKQRVTHIDGRSIRVESSSN